MSFIGGKARPHRARPTQPLKPGRNLGVVKVQVIAAVAADELEQPGIAAVRVALHCADGLAPQDRHQAVAKLTRRDREGIR